jgi:hypothetical protein
MTAAIPRLEDLALLEDGLSDSAGKALTSFALTLVAEKSFSLEF